MDPKQTEEQSAVGDGSEVADQEIENSEPLVAMASSVPSRSVRRIIKPSSSAPDVPSQSVVEIIQASRSEPDFFKPPNQKVSGKMGFEAPITIQEIRNVKRLQPLEKKEDLTEEKMPLLVDCYERLIVRYVELLTDIMDSPPESLEQNYQRIRSFFREQIKKELEFLMNSTDYPKFGELTESEEVIQPLFAESDSESSSTSEVLKKEIILAEQISVLALCVVEKGLPNKTDRESKCEYFFSLDIKDQIREMYNERLNRKESNASDQVSSPVNIQSENADESSESFDVFCEQADLIQKTGKTDLKRCSKYLQQYLENLFQRRQNGQEREALNEIPIKFKDGEEIPMTHPFHQVRGSSDSSNVGAHGSCGSASSSKNRGSSSGS